MAHTIYKLPADELHRYRTHLLCLDEESRYLRFGFYIKTDTIRDLHKRWTANPDKHIVFVIENDDLEVVGVAHISLEEEPAELAFSVFKECQGQGMGDALMKRAIEYCQNRGIKYGCMVCLNTNDKIKKLAKKNGILVVNEDGESKAEIQMPDPSPMSIWHEVVENNVAKIDHLGKAQRKLAKMFTLPLRF